MKEKLEVSSTLFANVRGQEIPFVRITREDGKQRTHHPRCPTHPGAPLPSHAVCCDCIYGKLAEKNRTP